MVKSFRSRWTLFNSAGFVLGFLSFGLVSAIAGLFKPEAVAQALEEGFNFFQTVEELREAVGPHYEIAYRYVLIQHLVMYPVFGAILGSAQAIALRKTIPNIWAWIGVSALGYLMIISGELIQPHIIIGPVPGPVEPILITLAAPVLAGIFQWLYLRKINYPSAKWLGFWIGGLVLGIIVAIAVLMGIGRLFGDAIQFMETNIPKLALGLELSILGGTAGAVAGWISSRALQANLGIPNKQDDHSAPKSV